MDPCRAIGKHHLAHYAQEDLVPISFLRKEKRISVKEAKEILKSLGIKLRRAYGWEKKAYPRTRLRYGIYKPLPLKKYLTPPQVEAFLRELYRRRGEKHLGKFF
jgi:hypothetical protein